MIPNPLVLFAHQAARGPHRPSRVHPSDRIRTHPYYAPGDEAARVIAFPHSHWDALFYGVAQFSGTTSGVALATFLLRGAPGDIQRRHVSFAVENDPVVFNV